MGFEFKEPLLFVENLSVAYGDTTIIKDISLVERDVVRSNETSTAQVIAVLGRSGRGKSTFFKALTGLITPQTGKILIKDFESKETEAAKTVIEGDIGFVDQKYTLFRHKTIEQTFNFALRHSRLNSSEKKSKINEYIKKWGLEACRDKYPNELSGGQRQRTAIIEQLLCSEKYLILDEPFSGLDIGNIAEVKKSFELLNNASEYNTVIFSTHDIDLAIELAQSIYIIGYPTIHGVQQSYGTIVAHYDLREMGLAWEPVGEGHYKLHKEIVHQMMIS